MVTTQGNWKMLFGISIRSRILCHIQRYLSSKLQKITGISCLELQLDTSPTQIPGSSNICTGYEEC